MLQRVRAAPNILPPVPSVPQHDQLGVPVVDAHHLPQDMAQEVWVALFQRHQGQSQNVLLLQLQEAESMSSLENAEDTS